MSERDTREVTFLERRVCSHCDQRCEKVATFGHDYAPCMCERCARKLAATFALVRGEVAP